MLAGAVMPASIPASSDRVRFEITVFIRPDITQFSSHWPDACQKTLPLLPFRPRVCPPEIERVEIFLVFLKKNMRFRLTVTMR